MSDLVYLVAQGKARYYAAAWLALTSVRRFGQLQGRLWLLADRPARVPAGVEVHVVPAAKLARPALYKAAIREVTDLAQWDTVTYLDADILVRGSLAPFIAAARATQRFIGVGDMGNRVTQGFCGASLDADEKARWAAHEGFNAGFFSAPGARLGAWFDAWDAALRHRPPPPGTGFDQPPLNAAILRGAIPAELVSDAMWFPRGHNQHGRAAEHAARRRAPLAHWHSVFRPSQLAGMAAHLALLAAVPAARRPAFELNSAK